MKAKSFIYVWLFSIVPSNNYLLLGLLLSTISIEKSPLYYKYYIGLAKSISNSVKRYNLELGWNRRPTMKSITNISRLECEDTKTKKLERFRKPLQLLWEIERMNHLQDRMCMAHMSNFITTFLNAYYNNSEEHVNSSSRLKQRQQLTFYPM